MKTLLLRRSFRCVLSAALLTLAGCTTSDPAVSARPAAEPPARAVRDAEELFQRGRATEAIMACIEIARKDPLTPGLPDLQRRILTRLNEQRSASISARAAASHEAMTQDARRHGIVPDTYGVSRHIIGDVSSHDSPRTQMQQALTNEISMHLEDVGLADIIDELGKSGINLVSDSDVSSKTLTIHTENTPLRELLEFIGRNLDVSFNVGETLIWATSRLPTDGPVPLETRVYRLRKGLSGAEVPGGTVLGTAAGASTGEPSMIEAITRFVPQPEGSDMLFDPRAHVLLVKNTKENLVSTEAIINAMDVRPNQVLIEARFVKTKVNDLQKLGIDWLFGSPVSTGAEGFENTLDLTESTEGAPDISLAGRDILMGRAPVEGGLTAGYFGVIDRIRLRAVINALESSGQGRTLTVPRLTTVNNKTASIFIGQEFRYYENYELAEVLNETEENRTTYQSQPVPEGDAVVKELGYQLKVTPSVGADLSTINLVLLPEISDVENGKAWADAYKPTPSGAGNDFSLMGKLPIFNRKTIETEVVVRSGETVVLGGLVTSEQTHDDKGIPWISRIPLINRLFGSRSDEDITENLIIFVTATLISDMGEDLIPLTPRTIPGTEVPTTLIREELGIEEHQPEPLLAPPE
ncbi:MAG: hypothetical protein FJ222_00315 [Lentisphaerae bacterium]|nr:hypothetical protein [Lentisphaerota bacterium]